MFSSKLDTPLGVAISVSSHPGNHTQLSAGAAAVT